MKLYKNSIPIGNIYYMLAYAFRDLAEQEIVLINPEKFDNIQQIMAEIIVHGVSYQLKKGLCKSYKSCEDELLTLKGKINISDTINRVGIINGRYVCRYDEYTENTIMNRIRKSVMLLLIRSEITSEQITEISKLIRYFGNITEIQLAYVKWDLLTYNRNNREYRLLMNVCRIICENMLHTTDDGNVTLTDFSDSNLNRLYEKFILNYYIKHYRELNPKSAEIKWAFGNKNNCPMIPKMQSDIILTNKNKRLIIDAKFYSHNTSQNYDKETFRSHNLYQIFTYVKNESYNFGGKVSGMLLYAKTNDDIIPSEGCTFEVCDNEFSVMTLDLQGDFTSIKKQLNTIAEIE